MKAKVDIAPEEEFRRIRDFATWTQERKYEHIQKLTPTQILALKHTWAAWARDNQLTPPGTWSTWVVRAGRGWGKTRTGAEWVIEKAKQYPGCHIALVGRTVADVRGVMVNGLSGVMAVSPPWFLPTYVPSKRQLVWPNGSHASTYSADSPDQLRGPQHSFAWADERAAWSYDDAWDQLMFGLRIEPAPGVEPQAVVTTTPRNTKSMKALLKEPNTIVTKGTTYDNKDNLSKRFIHEIDRKYAGSRLGAQEILGEIIDDIEGALWKREWIDNNRVQRGQHPELKRIVVGVDPPGSSDKTSEDPAECGIVVVGLGVDNQGYVLADYSLVGTPNEWASEAIKAYDFFKADHIIGEVNFGGEMVGTIIKSLAKEKGLPNIPFKAVRASRGKQVRAEPVSNLYQQNSAHHVGVFSDLEDQLCNWLPGDKSPDRLDALVWAITELMLGGSQGGGVYVELSSDEELKQQLWDEEQNDEYAALWRPRF